MCFHLKRGAVECRLAHCEAEGDHARQHSKYKRRQYENTKVDKMSKIRNTNGKLNENATILTHQGDIKEVLQNMETGIDRT